ncbi:MAG: helix-turn-helix domain-containing protein [Bacteroidota bacterium]
MTTTNIDYDKLSEEYRNLFLEVEVLSADFMRFFGWLNENPITHGCVGFECRRSGKGIFTKVRLKNGEQVDRLDNKTMGVLMEGFGQFFISGFMTWCYGDGETSATFLQDVEYDVSFLPPDVLIDVEEAAKRLGVTTRTIRNRCNDLGVQKFGGSYVITPQDFLRMAAIKKGTWQNRTEKETN